MCRTSTETTRTVTSYLSADSFILAFFVNQILKAETDQIFIYLSNRQSSPSHIDRESPPNPSSKNFVCARDDSGIRYTAIVHTSAPTGPILCAIKQSFRHRNRPLRLETYAYMFGLGH